MSLAQVGIHVPNGVPAGQTEEAMMNALLDVGYRAYFSLDWNAAWLYQCYQRYPTALMVVRWYHTNIMGKNPATLAATIADWYDSPITPGGPKRRQFVTHHCSGNELNLKSEHGGPCWEHGDNHPDDYWSTQDGYQGINRWLKAHYEALKTETQQNRGFTLTLHFPAFSPGHGEDDLAWRQGATWDGMHECSQAIGLSDVYDDHVYHPPGFDPYDPNNPQKTPLDPNWWNDEFYGARYEQKIKNLDDMTYYSTKVMITEFNRPWNHWSPSDGEAYAREVKYFRDRVGAKHPTRILATCGFIWSGESKKTLLNGTAGAGQKVVPVASTADFEASDDVIIYDDNGHERNTIASINPGVSFNMAENLKNTYTVAAHGGVVKAHFRDLMWWGPVGGAQPVVAKEKEYVRDQIGLAPCLVHP